MKLWFLVLILSGGSLAFLPTKLNFSDPDISDIFCPELITEPMIWDLKAITREGLRREVRNLFNEDPPAGSTGFYVPVDASLSEMFHMYYGPDASATRFYKAVNNIAWSNADVDSMESTKYDTRYHFDGNQLADGQALLSARHNLIVSAIIQDQSYDYARQQLGYSLHAIQDFYSYSTWVELGNTEIIENLGLPSFTFDNIAGDDDVTCTPCPSAEGSCTGNVILGGKLTSGYYEYNISEAESFIIDKPEGKGKCSFGGSLDTSSYENPIGGINKASTSPCFSPHYFAHNSAVQLAIEATENYLGIIRSTIGNEEFRFLLDLYQGSALCVVIDTTGSMGGEIDAVKEEVALIVENSPADLYILVPYNDPDYGPLTKTTDSQEFLDAVNALEPYNGGGDVVEMVWHGMQLALTNTPDYSTLYLFTDAGGKDKDLMNGDFALAQQKNIIVTVVYSYNNAAPPAGDYTDDTDYMRLAEVTGGEFITIDDFSVDDVVSILDNGIEESKVSMAVRRNIIGSHNFNILVDDTISSLIITISGEVSKALLTNPSGTKTYDLMDKASLILQPSVIIDAYTTTVKVIEFAAPDVGEWNIQTSSLTTYDVLADGSSILGYLTEFTELDRRPPRPNYKLINGNPIEGLSYYVEIILVGWIESSVTSVTSMQFINEKGDVLSTVSYYDNVDDEIYIKSYPIPDSSFYVVTNGYLASGNQFTRIFQTVIIPTTISVAVDLSQSILTAPPGATVDAFFTVRNYGPATKYDYYATDEKAFISTFTPASSVISANGTETVQVTFVVPSDAEPWTESTVIVTASSELSSDNVNSDISYFLVTPENLDIISPTCTSSDVPDCTGYHSSSTCSLQTWTVSATLQDADSGLSSISTQPSNSMTNLDVPVFTEGTTDPVDVTLTASCCLTQLQIIGLDGQGNIGICSYALGPLDGVSTFEAIDEGTTWVYLEWTVDSVRSDLLKYTVVTDSVFSNDVLCFDPVCHFNSTSLKPCTLHFFTLTPYFDEFGNSTIIEGNKAATEDSTLDEVPGMPTNVQVSPSGTDGTTVDVTWNPPSDTSCLSGYRVCYWESVNSSAACVETTNTYYEITDLQPCVQYNISVAALSNSGLSSQPVTIASTSGTHAPGAPQNLQVDDITDSYAEISWDPPLNYSSCVDRYDVTWNEIGGSIVKTISQKEASSRKGAFDAIVSPLLACTNYSFRVYGVSADDELGPYAEAFGETDEINPTAPSFLSVEATGTTSLSVTWNVGDGLCILYYELCVEDPISATDQCFNVTGSGYIIQGLVSCTTYTVELTAVSPSGLRSTTIYASGSTDDEEPGPPTNLTVSNVTSHSVTIQFDAPVVNPQCVDEYDIDYIDLSGDISATRNTISERAENSNVLTGIEACTNVFIMVRALSPRGLESEWANTTATTLEDIPSVPQNLQVDAVTDTTITISWFVPATNERCIDHYNVMWLGQFGGSGLANVPIIDGIIKYQYTISSLTTCNTYNIGVSGITTSGAEGLTAITNGRTSC